MAVQTALVVDDSKSARVSLSRLLKKSGVTVHMCGSAEEAFVQLVELKPDLIFMDHLMPGMDGLEAVGKLNEDDRYAHIPVVMCTGKDEDETYISTVRAAGAMAVLGKPPTSEKLQKILEEANERQPQVPMVNEVVKPIAKTQPMAAASTVMSASSQDSASASKAKPTVSHQQIERIVSQVLEEALQRRLQEVVLSAVKNELTDTLKHQLNTKEQIKALDNQMSDFDTWVKQQLSAERDAVNAELQKRFDELSPQRLQISENVADLKSQLADLTKQFAEGQGESKDQKEQKEKLLKVYKKVVSLEEKLNDTISRTFDLEKAKSRDNDKGFVTRDVYEETKQKTLQKCHSLEKKMVHLKEVTDNSDRRLEALTSAFQKQSDNFKAGSVEYGQFALALGQDVIAMFEPQLHSKVKGMLEEQEAQMEAKLASYRKKMLLGTLVSAIAFFGVVGLGAMQFLGL